MGNPTDDLYKEMHSAALELAQYASYAEIVGGIHHNRSQIREWCDKVFAIHHKIDTAINQELAELTAKQTFKGETRPYMKGKTVPVEAHCHTCGQKREFKHLHDTAYGMPETHMAGSERFTCTVCGESIHVGDNDGQFKFILDKPHDQTNPAA